MRVSRRTRVARVTRAAVGLVAAALVLGACSGGDGDGRSPASPRPAALPAPLPSLTLDSFDGGDPVDLAELRGPLVINVWASWCGPCREEMPVLQEFARKHAGEVDVVGIDFQDPQSEKARELVEETGVTYPLYVDLDGELHRNGPFPHLKGLPFLAFVDAEGQVVERQFVIIDDVAELEELVAEHLGVT